MGWRSHFLIQEGLSPSKFSGFAEDISVFSRVQKGMLECGWIKQPSDCFHYITGSTTGNQLWDRLVLTATTALQETNSPVVQCKRSQCKGITNVIIQYIIHITYVYTCEISTSSNLIHSNFIQSNDFIVARTDTARSHGGCMGCNHHESGTVGPWVFVNNVWGIGLWTIYDS